MWVSVEWSVPLSCWLVLSMFTVSMFSMFSVSVGVGLYIVAGLVCSSLFYVSVELYVQ